MSFRVDGRQADLYYKYLPCLIIKQVLVYRSLGILTLLIRCNDCKFSAAFLFKYTRGETTRRLKRLVCVYGGGGGVGRRGKESKRPVGRNDKGRNGFGATRLGVVWF